MVRPKHILIVHQPHLQMNIQPPGLQVPVGRGRDRLHMLDAQCIRTRQTGAAMVNLHAVDVEPVDELCRPTMSEPPLAFKPECAVRCVMSTALCCSSGPDHAPCPGVVSTLCNKPFQCPVCGGEATVLISHHAPTPQHCTS